MGGVVCVGRRARALHGRFTQRALLHRTPRMRRVNGRCGLRVANETTATQPHTLLFLRSAPRVAWYCRGDRVGYVLLLGRGAAFAPSRPRHGCGALLRWGGGRRGWGTSAGGREVGKGRRGAWQHVPTHTSVPMPIARSLRVVQCHLSLGSCRHPVESGHAPADRSATWLRFRGGSSSLPITLQRATAVCRCVRTVRAPHPSSSRASTPFRARLSRRPASPPR